MRKFIDNILETIDSRDVIDFIAKGQPPEVSDRHWQEILDFAQEGEDYSDIDWRCGMTFIRDDYFEEYARQLAEEMYIDSLYQWPFSCIDWDEAAHELQADYTIFDFGGVTYWAR